MQVTIDSITFKVVPNEPAAGQDPWLGGSQAFWHRVNKGLWEPSTYRIFRRYLSPDHSYLDIGAWVGPTVLYGAQLSKRCFAFEPDPIAFAGLLRNIAENPNIGNVSLHQMAIAPQPGEILMGSRTGRGDSMSSILLPTDPWKVQAISLALFAESYDIDDCNFIKMDIEGAESVVLPASIEFFRALKPTLLLSIHPEFFTDKMGFGESIHSVLSLYKYLYDEAGNLISLNQTLKLLRLPSLLATDEPL